MYLIRLLFLLENNLIGMDKAQLALGFLLYVFIRLHIVLVLFELGLALLLRFQLRLKLLLPCLVSLVPVIQGYNLY